MKNDFTLLIMGEKLQLLLFYYFIQLFYRLINQFILNSLGTPHHSSKIFINHDSRICFIYLVMETTKSCYDHLFNKSPNLLLFVKFLHGLQAHIVNQREHITQAARLQLFS